MKCQNFEMAIEREVHGKAHQCFSWRKGEAGVILCHRISEGTRRRPDDYGGK